MVISYSKCSHNVNEHWNKLSDKALESESSSPNLLINNNSPFFNIIQIILNCSTKNTSIIAYESYSVQPAIWLYQVTSSGMQSYWQLSLLTNLWIDNGMWFHRNRVIHDISRKPRCPLVCHGHLVCTVRVTWF